MRALDVGVRPHNQASLPAGEQQENTMTVAERHDSTASGREVCGGAAGPHLSATGLDGAELKQDGGACCVAAQTGVGTCFDGLSNSSD
jgi:hypothetical protein